MTPKEFVVRLFLPLDSLHIINPSSWRAEPIRGLWILLTILPQGPRFRLSVEAKAQSPTYCNLLQARVCSLGRNRGRLQGAPPPTLSWDVGVAGTEAANTGSWNRSPRRACWLVKHPTHPVRGRCWRRHTRSPCHAGAPANQSLAAVQRLTNPKSPWRNKGALALQDQVPEDLNTWLFILNG